MRGNTLKLNALQVAEFFINKANEEKRPITNKKLQKLVYYAQAWSLVLRNKRIFSEKIEAWVHGPAIKSLYVEYKRFGFGPIEKKITVASIKKIPKDTVDLLNNVWNVYGNFDANYLEMLTHSESPWKDAREGLQISQNSEAEIKPDVMKAYYSKKLKDTETVSTQ